MNLPGFAQPPMSEEEREIILHAISKDASSRLTICEQIRFIYDTVLKIEDEAIKQDLTDKLIIAFNMGKKMNSRLAHYKRAYTDQGGRTGRNLLWLKQTKERKEIRANR